MGQLYVQFLCVVLGGVPLPPDGILQPSGDGVYQVLQEHKHEVSISLVCTVFVTASAIEVTAS